MGGTSGPRLEFLSMRTSSFCRVPTDPAKQLCSTPSARSSILPNSVRTAGWCIISASPISPRSFAPSSRIGKIHAAAGLLTGGDFLSAREQVRGQFAVLPRVALKSDEPVMLDGMRFEELREQFDHIVIDTPPTLSVTDAVVLSPRVDAIILVIRSGQTTKQALRRARDILMQVNARVTGVLLNAVDLTSPDYYYYYEYQGKYSHYYQEDPPEPPAESGSAAQPRVAAGT